MKKRFAKACRDERGIGGIEGLAFGVLVFVFGMLVVVNAWGVIDAKLAVNAASREAARALVEANSLDDGQSSASAAANSAMAGHNRVLDDLLIVGGSSFGRCQSVEVTAVTKVPRIAMPLIGSTGGTYVVSSTHNEIVDPYRSGLSGTANCA